MARRLPPPVLALAAGVVQHRLARHRRRTPLSDVLAAGLLAGSAVLLAGTSSRFHRAGTTYDPFHPESATSLVTTGPNAVTRNPMYVGMAGVLLAQTALRRSPVSLLPVAGFVALIDRTQIPAEEAALAELFGEEYDDYRERVPRWLVR